MWTGAATTRTNRDARSLALRLSRVRLMSTAGRLPLGVKSPTRRRRSGIRWQSLLYLTSRPLMGPRTFPARISSFQPITASLQAFPPVSVDFSDVSLADTTSLRLRFKTFFPEGIDASRYQILMKIQLAKPGYGRKPGLMRNFLAEAPCSSGEGTASFLIDDYANRWKLDLDEYQVHCRYVLLDRLTGYRNIHTTLSFPIKLR